MITIQTSKMERATCKIIYKDYRCTTEGSIALAMEQINHERLNNDLVKYYPIQIYNIFES